MRLIEDALRRVVLLFRSTEAIQTENLFLHRQLALYIDSLASSRVAIVLATEVPTRSSSDPKGTAHADSPDGAGESPLGRRAHRE